LTTAVAAHLGYIDNLGLERLRSEIAAYLGRARNVAASPDQIAITAGTTHSLSLVTRVLARQGAHTIGFENPSNRHLHAVAARNGLEPIGVRVDRDGLVVSELAQASVGAVVVSPAHQFPTGRSLSSARRAELVDWAAANEAIIIEDEYDAEFRYDRAPSDALHGLSPERVVYVGSTGKTLAPGIRLGWAVLPPNLLDDVREELALSVHHISGLDQLTFFEFLRHGEYDRHLRRMRSTYRRRRNILVECLNQRFRDINVGGIAAGIHVVLELDCPELEAFTCERARACRIRLESISDHVLPGYGGASGVLIGFGAISEPAVPAAVDELADAVAETIAHSRAGRRPPLDGSRRSRWS
jgi:GntR family transcriptional regulator/MocR family aminotransferase